MDDPRDRVTEQAFRVDPALLGTPLAGGWRRLLALLLDLTLAGISAKLLGSVVLVLLGLLFLRSARRASTSEDRFGPARRRLLYTASILALGSALVRSASSEEPSAVVVVNVQNDKDEETDRAASEAIAELVEVLADGPGGPEAAGRLVAASTAGIDRLESVLSAEVARLEAAADACRERPADERTDWTVVALLRAVFESFGLTISWVGLYFTAFLGLWDGRTSAKRLLGMRVVRLDGRPLTLWNAFERFSGYGAGLATGLLGFAQIFWDGNRQAIHDKISSTVVIRTDRPPTSVLAEREP